MSIRFFLLIFFIVILHSYSSTDLEANWEPFDITGNVELTPSIDFIRKIPISIYWDSIKGGYKPGIISEKFLQLFPDKHDKLVKIPKQLTHVNKSGKLDMLMVDQNYLNTEMLLCIKALLASHQEIKEVMDNKLNGISSIFQLEEDEQTLIKRLSDSYEFENINYLRDQVELLTLETEELRLFNENIMEEYTKEEKIMNDYFLEQENKINDMYEKESENMKEIETKIQKESEQYQQKLEELIKQISLIESEIDYKEIQQEFELELQKEEENYHDQVELIEYEIQETLEYEKNILKILSMDEKNYFEHIKKNNELMIQDTIKFMEELIYTFFQNFFYYLKNLILFKWDYWKIPLQIFSSLIFFFFMIEFFQFFYNNWLIIRGKSLKMKDSFKGNWSLYLRRMGLIKVPLGSKNRINSASLSLIDYLSITTREKFNHELKKSNFVLKEKNELILQNFVVNLSINSWNSLPLPHLILSGPPGTGKSSALYLISRSIPSMNRLHLSVSDLLVLGNRSSHFLMHLFEKIKRKQFPTVLFLDDCDQLIYSRVSTGKVVHNSFSFNGFFPLLDLMKYPQSYLSIVLATRLPLSQVDNALLDRMDYLASFDSPSLIEKFRYISLSFFTIFSDLIPKKNVKYFPLVDSNSSDIDESVSIESFYNIYTEDLTQNYLSNNINLLDLSLSKTSEINPRLIFDHLNQEIIKLNNSQSLDIPYCSKILAKLLDLREYSYRDIYKELINIRIAILSENPSIVTTSFWHQELKKLI